MNKEGLQRREDVFLVANRADLRRTPRFSPVLKEEEPLRLGDERTAVSVHRCEWETSGPVCQIVS